MGPKQEILDERVRKLLKAKSYIKACDDKEFLGSPELRHVRLQLELLKPELILSEHGVKSTVVIFGSARTRDEEESKKRIEELTALAKKNPADKKIKSQLDSAERLKRSSKYYDVARDFTKIVSSQEVQPGKKLVVVTGGGPGIMEAANRGAYDAGAKSIGLNITLKMEQGPNPYVSPELCFQFQYFAIRKLHFVMRSKALVVFPGGFGTMDELFEVLTLVQTGKKNELPIVLVGEEFWRDVINFDNFAKWGYIAQEDLRLFRFADTPDQIWAHIKDFYKHHDMPANLDV